MLALKKPVFIAACVVLSLGASAAELPQQNNQRHLRSLGSADFHPGRVAAAVEDLAVAQVKEEDADASDDAATATGAENANTPIATHQDYEWVDEPPANFGAQVVQREDEPVGMADTTTVATAAEEEQKDSNEDSSEEEDDAPGTTSALTEGQANDPQESKQVFAATAVAATADGDADQEDSSEDSIEYASAAAEDDSADDEEEDSSEEQRTEDAAATNEGDDQEVTVNLEGENKIEIDAAPGDIVDIEIEDAN